MATAAVRAQGTLLKIGDGGSPETFTTVAEFRDISGPAQTADTIEVTSQDSPSHYKEFIPGLKDGGDVSGPMNFVNSAAQDALLTDMENQTKRNFQIVTTHSPAKTAAFAGYITNISHTFNLNEAAMRNVTIKVTGAVTWS